MLILIESFIIEINRIACHKKKAAFINYITKCNNKDNSSKDAFSDNNIQLHAKYNQTESNLINVNAS